MASETDPDMSAELSSWKFYRAIEEVLKRHQPVVYADFASARLREAAKEKPTDITKWSQTPHFRVLHSIEANCAYARGHNNDPVTLNRLFRVMNIYHDLEPTDLVSRALDDGNIDLAMLQMWRQQIELQQDVGNIELARAWRIFGTSPQSLQLSSEFDTKYGVTPKDWIRLCFATYALANKNPSSRLTTDLLHHPYWKFTPQTVNAFLHEATWTPKDLGQHFRDVRNAMAPENHSLIRTSFFDRPLLDFGSGRLLAPDINLLSRFAAIGVYVRAKGLPSFGDERGFPSAFERYIADLLPHFSERPLILSAGAMKSALVPQKSCDFLVQSESEILLVECKATSFTSQFLTEKVMENDTSTRRIAEATVQIFATAESIGQGKLDHLGVNRSKPLYGIVMTFGTIPFVNSPWYKKQILSPKVRAICSGNLVGENRLMEWPTTMPVSAVERMAIACRHLSLTVRQLWDEWNSKPYVLNGEWTQFLRQKLAGTDAPPIEVMKKNLDEFMATFREPKDGTFGS